MRRTLTTSYRCALCAGMITTMALANPPTVNFENDVFVDGFNLFNMGDEPGSLALANFIGDPTKPFSLVTANLAVTPKKVGSRQIALRLSADGQTWTNTIFLKPTESFLTSELKKVIAADFNGDFVDDLVFVNMLNPAVLFVFLHVPIVIPDPINDPLGNAGTFTTIYAMGTDVGASPEDMATGDLDGNGTLDLVIVSPADGRIEVLLNSNGAGDFPVAARSTISLVAAPKRIAIADVTGDTILDLIVSDGATGTVKILAGDGLGGFTMFGSISSPANELAVGDLDNDGDLDLVTAPAGARAFVTVFFNDGAGVFGAPLLL